ncbi:CBS domain-containing protein [Spirochaetia bacterium 38H-sp]|uniref:CBS domain-containing protein n=1 Tax=Rarispira pelagica TaxID=3141764 RepID=A0ABU9UBC7_9SPIR
MKLSSYLYPEYIKLDSAVSDFDQAALMLLDSVKSLIKEKNTQELLTLVKEREKQAPTVFDDGLCVPHLRLDNFDDHIIAICIPKEPFIYAEKTVKIMVMIISSKAKPSSYLNTLSGIAKLIKNQQIRQKLLDTKNADQLINIIKENDIEVEKGITVADIMSDKVIAVQEETSLKEVIDLFVKNHTSFIPVTDNHNTLLGEIRMFDILQIGLPQYTSMIGNLRFLKSFEPFEELLKKEEQLKAKDIMKKPHPLVNPDTSIIELAFEISREQRRHVAVVTKDNKLAGVVSIMDILDKVLRV